MYLFRNNGKQSYVVVLLSFIILSGSYCVISTGCFMELYPMRALCVNYMALRQRLDPNYDILRVYFIGWCPVSPLIHLYFSLEPLKHCETLPSCFSLKSQKLGSSLAETMCFRNKRRPLEVMTQSSALPPEWV